MLDVNKAAAVIWVMIADDKSFTLTPISTNTDPSMLPGIQDLSETLNNMLIICDNNIDNHIVVSLFKLDQTHPSATNFSPPNDEKDSLFLKLQLTDALMRTSLIVKQNNVSLAVEYCDAINYKLSVSMCPKSSIEGID